MGLDDVLAPETNGSLLNLAEGVVQRLGHPRGIVGKDWARDFGSRTCQGFRATYTTLSNLVVDYDGRVRLLCHCVPLRCHNQSLAKRLWCSTYTASSKAHLVSCTEECLPNSTTGLDI